MTMSQKECLFVPKDRASLNVAYTTLDEKWLFDANTKLHWKWQNTRT